MVDDASLDDDPLIAQGEQGEDIRDLEQLWSIHNDCNEDDRNNVISEDGPEPFLVESDLIGVGGANSVVTLYSDSDGHEDACRDSNVTQTICPGCDGVEDLTVGEEDLTREDQVGDDDEHVDHAEDHQQLVEQVAHLSGNEYFTIKYSGEIK